jgi:hypothetical protein
MSVLRFWRDLTFQYPCSQSGGNLTEGSECKLCPCDWY